MATVTIAPPNGIPIIHTDKVFAYFVNPAGKIMAAPDTRVSPKQCGLGPQWRRCEAVGAREIERVSLIISKQLWEEKKQRAVQQKLREMGYVEMKAVEARLRAAKGFSENDVSINRQMEAKWNRHKEQAIALIYSEFDPTRRNTALDMELKDEPSVRHHFGQKRKGIA